MDIIIWTIIILLFVISFVGVVLPIIPSVIFLWLGFVLYHFFINDDVLTVFFWLVTSVLTIILVMADLLTNRYFVQQFGGNKRSEWGAIIGIVIGTFIYPPFGMIVLPFVIVFLIEIISRRTVKEALYAALGAFIGFLSGIVAKVLIQAMMVLFFIIKIIIA
ncbi:MAG TPA: DUF456 family protein [Pseudogracilibacillus sp.]|nr:DUF456 family protein [Pseudogracilibacillus sp.]